MEEVKKIVAFGEVMLRLTPPDHRLIEESSSFDACYGGSEGNVLIALSSLGHDTRFLTALPDDGLGRGVLRALRSYGVDCSSILIQGDRLGMYFVEEGFSSRPANVIYMRKGSEVSKLSPGAFDYDEIFEDAAIFHISGISFALSQSCRALCFSLVKEAKRRGITVSFDFNYRGKLWTTEEAASVYKEIIPLVDIAFGSEKDLRVFLDTDKEDFFNIYEPKYLILREKTVHPDGCVSADSELFEDRNGKICHYEIKGTPFPVLEKIGGGDAFAAGVLHGLLSGKAPKEALAIGMAAYRAKHTVKGDTLPFSDKQLSSFYSGTVKDISR